MTFPAVTCCYLDLIRLVCHALAGTCFCLAVTCLSLPLAGTCFCLSFAVIFFSWSHWLSGFVSLWFAISLAPMYLFWIAFAFPRVSTFHNLAFTCFHSVSYLSFAHTYLSLGVAGPALPPSVCRPIHGSDPSLFMRSCAPPPRLHRPVRSCALTSPCAAAPPTSALCAAAPTQLVSHKSDLSLYLIPTLAPLLHFLKISIALLKSPTPPRPCIYNLCSPFLWLRWISVIKDKWAARVQFRMTFVGRRGQCLTTSIHCHKGRKCEGRRRDLSPC